MAARGAAAQTKNNSAAEGGAGVELFSGDVKITADEATRSLVIIASAADYKSLEPVIEELDADRKQVYLEIYLLEASIGRTLDHRRRRPLRGPVQHPGRPGRRLGRLGAVARRQLAAALASRRCRASPAACSVR